MKPIPGFSDYFADIHGNVWSKKSGVLMELKSYKEQSGYLSVRPCREGKNINVRVHTLIAMTYLDKKEKNFEVNHINGKKDDNSIDNLEWVSHSKNVKHSYCYLNRKRPSKGVIPSPFIKKLRAVELTCLETGEQSKFESLADAARKTGLLQSSITKVCKGVLQQTGGYVARYVNGT
jgi:HNH endonuclease